MGRTAIWRRAGGMSLLVLGFSGALAAVAGQQAQPQITLAPGLNPVPDYRTLVVDPPAAKTPEGFTPIFNGKDLSGWHISKTNHHGETQGWKVDRDAITGTQDKPGHGGILPGEKVSREIADNNARVRFQKQLAAELRIPTSS